MFIPLSLEYWQDWIRT